MISITRDIGLVSFTGNPILLSIISYNHEDGGVPRPFYTVFCEIFFTDPAGGGAADHTESIQVDSSGNGQFDLSEILKPYTKPTFPWPLPVGTQAVKDTGAIKKFWIRLRDGYGVPFVLQAVSHTSTPYYAIPGGLSDEVLQAIEAATSNAYAFITANKILLTSQPTGKRTALNQPEVLRYFNYSATQITGAKLKVKQTNFAGTETTSNIWTGNLDALSLYTFNVTPNIVFTPVANLAKWEVFLTTSADALISEIASWQMTEFVGANPRTFVFQNSQGGFDTLLSVGARTLTEEGEAKSGYVAKTSTVRKWLEPTQDRRSTKNVYRGLLGYFSNDELRWIREFFSSEKRYLVIDARLEYVVLRQNEFPSETDQPPGAIEIEAVIGSPLMFFFS